MNNADGTARGQGVERYTRNLSSRINLYPVRSPRRQCPRREWQRDLRRQRPERRRLQPRRPTAAGGSWRHDRVRVRPRVGTEHQAAGLDLPVGLQQLRHRRRPGHDQIVAVKTDGSGIVEVFGFSHHTNTSITRCSRMRCRRLTGPRCCSPPSGAAAASLRTSPVASGGTRSDPAATERSRAGSTRQHARSRGRRRGP